ncbi:MAG TPA: type 4a pilus biogenesis protein PilO [Gaiellaceae bacterium]|nr:type 4a pilus biogenesis protein PilO [Gaiellaceae bacterium]
MTARLKNMSKGGQIAVAVGGLLLVVAVGWFAVIGPKRSTANSLKQQTAAVQAQIAANKSSAFTQALPAVRSASVFRLAMAMPTKVQTADIILQLNALAQNSGISFDRIEPNASSGTSAVAGTVSPDPFVAVPIQVQFTGSFYNLLSFLQRVRNLVRVQGNRLYTAGRLFDVSQVSFAEAQGGWPQITATLTLNAFVPQPPQPVVPATPGSTTSSTTTTGTTTTTSSGTSAAPSTSGGTS